jgi:hypothetical protein
MVRFSIADTGCRKQDMKYLILELRKNNLIAATEKDVNGDPIYHTNNILAVKKIAEDYDGLMIETLKA